MKVAIMQPYFFPYIGQFQLINSVDRFILMDDVQYIRHGWINRNRVLSPNEGVQYLIAPLVKHSYDTKIKMIRVVEGQQWKKSLLGQLTHYKKKSPYYSNVIALVKECLSLEDTNITRLNGHFFIVICNYLGISFKLEIASTLELDYSGVEETQDWAIEVSKQLGATEYYNPPGGAALYDKEKFAEKGIDLKFVQPQLKPYDQLGGEFIPGLSILDVMMFNSPETIKNMLNDFTLI